MLLLLTIGKCIDKCSKNGEKKRIQHNLYYSSWFLIPGFKDIDSVKSSRINEWVTATPVRLFI